MNNVLDENIERLPLQQQKNKSEEYRQIGIGIMGLADMLIKLGFKYGDENSIHLCNSIGSFLINESMRASSLLAKEFGTFPKYDYEKLIKSDFYQKNINSDVKKIVEKYGMRNNSLLSIAPNGSISTMLGISGGIEPIFAFSYSRTTKTLHKEDKIYKVYTPIVKDYMKINNLNNENQLPNFFICSKDIYYLNRIQMQSIWQKYIDTAISSTINLPFETTEETIQNIYIEAWKNGLKGITIYRDNCSRQGILNSNPQGTITNTKLNRGDWEEIPNDTIYVKRKLYSGCGKLNLFIGYSPSMNKIVEMYVKKSAKGGCIHNIDALVISMSAIYRLGGNFENIEKAFEGCGSCSSFVQARAKGEKVSKGMSCPTAILHELKQFEENLNDLNISNIEQAKETRKIFTVKEMDFLKTYGETSFVEKFMKCPTCSSAISIISGCKTCTNCGYSKCD